MATAICLLTSSHLNTCSVKNKCYKDITPYQYIVFQFSKHKALFGCSTLLFSPIVNTVLLGLQKGLSDSKKPPLSLLLNKVTAALLKQHCNSFSTVLFPSASLAHCCCK